MSPAHGRPPSKDPAVKAINLRLGKTDSIRLDYCSGKLGKTKAEVLRLGLEKLYFSLVRDSKETEK